MVETTAALEAHNISKRYGDVPASAGVSLAVAAGSCVALVGESGSGKTTLLRCFNRMVAPDSGSVASRALGGTAPPSGGSERARRPPFARLSSHSYTGLLAILGEDPPPTGEEAYRRVAALAGPVSPSRTWHARGEL